MWSFRAWRRRRLLARHPVAEELWQRVRRHLPILDGLDADEDRRLRERAVLFLADKHLTALAGVDLDDFGRLLLAAQAQLPLLHLPEPELVPGLPRAWCCIPMISSARRNTATPAA